MDVPLVGVGPGISITRAAVPKNITAFSVDLGVS